MSARDAAEVIGVDQSRIYQLIRDGELTSQVFEGIHLIDRAQVEKFARTPKTTKAGRPRKMK